MKVNFIIPVRHPDMVTDRDGQFRRLKQLILSISAQSSDAWQAIFCVNHGQVLPELPKNFHVVHVDFPPNQAAKDAKDGRSFYDAIALDKGRRIAAALELVGPDDLIMPADDDDFLHRDLVAHVLSDDWAGGWIIDRGYVWRTDSTLLRRLDGLHWICGTSILAPKKMYSYFSDPAADKETALQELGNHKAMLAKHPEDSGVWKRVPFRAIIYRVGHPDTTLARNRQGFRRRQLGAVGRAVRNIRDRTTRILQGHAIDGLPDRVLTSKRRQEFFGE